MGSPVSLAVGIFVLGAVLSGSPLHTRAASFYGESYVALKTEESFSTSSLQLRFRTSKPNGLLFLAAGKNDYYLLQLHSGRVQVKIKFGKDEQVIVLDQGPQLDDLDWHFVALNHENGNVLLSVDTLQKLSRKIAGGAYEMKVQHGLYVGGLGELHVPYKKEVHGFFRGCLDDVIFNDHKLLSSLRPYPGLKSVHEVSLGCSEEFFVTEDDPINFFSSKSYIAFPSWNVIGEGIWEGMLQTSVGRGLLLYQSGKAGHFVSLEIQDWMLTARVGKGKNIVHLSSVYPIMENKWHSVEFKITEQHMHLEVDRESTTKVLLPSSLKVVPLNGPLYIGGVDDASRPQLVSLGLHVVLGKHAKGGSFKGCMKNLKLNSVKYGLKRALATKDISPGCKTEISVNHPVLESNMAALTTVAPTINLITSPMVAKDKAKGRFLVLNNLIVPEGGRAALQSKHIKLQLDFKKLGLRQSQIIFRVEEYPHHGQLKMEVAPDQEKNVFTMLDLWHGRIAYIHDGSEGTWDSLTFSVTTTSKNEMPSYLRGIELHIFNITITPVNDAPTLVLPEGNLFVLMENSKKPLTGNLLKILDVDTEPQNLSLVVLGNLNLEAGSLEHAGGPGKALTTFSYSDVLEGNILYAHRGVKNSRLVLRAVDGDKVSNTMVLRILAVPLEFSMVNNTGIDVIQGESSLIQTSNLAVETNAGNQEIEIRYEITEMPKFGQIQRKSSGNEWKSAASFSQRFLERERVRYLSTYKEVQETNATEYFTFKITIGNKSSEERTFPIRVQWVHFTLFQNSPLKVEGTKKASIGSENIFVALKEIQVQEKELYFKLLSLPKKGNLLVNDEVLKEHAKFSQLDIRNGKVEYELVDRPQEDSQDSFTFAIFTKHAESRPNTFIIDLKADLNTIILTNNGLSITEGGAKLITREMLFVQTMNNKTFTYKVAKSPQHGSLKLINFSDSQLSNSNITSFSSQDIVGERLMYVHDDSETTFDTFIVQASSVVSDIRNDEDDAVPLQTELVFNVSIELKNDEKPVRVVDKHFHVVRNGQRLLTLEDLCYHDPDTDFNDSELLYTRRGIPNGDLVSTNDPSKKLYQFTQGDLEKKQVLFIHHGSDYGRFVLFITDGKHYTSSLLEVIASEPFVNVVNNTGLLVQKGKEKTLTTANFSTVTNLYINGDDEITYNVLLPPRHGKLFLHNSAVDSFNYHHLKLGQVAYKHDDSNNLVDTFNLTVKVKSLVLNAEIKVRVYLESHQRLPKVLHLKGLLVEEGKPVKIDKENLQVIHEDSSPSEIVFTVVVYPLHGYLRTSDSAEGHVAINSSSLVTFTQKDINNGNIQYVQTGSVNEQDNFTMEVTNGVREIPGITLSIEIIPILIPLEVQNITVNEGASKALTPEQLTIPNKHFTPLNSDFVLVDLPKSGYIENRRIPGVKLTHFNTKQVEQELIFYIHDDSETVLDTFTLIVNNSDLSKQSIPRTIYVTINPVNDEIPVITANRIFRVWVGSVTEVTSEDLAAEDKDSPPTDLLYSITPPNNGHLALKSDPNKSILNFTQENINTGQVVFVHSGAMSGGFNFQVTDGLNFAPRQIFSITAKTLVINVDVNKGLGVFPGSQKGISSDVLKAVTNDDHSKNRMITFHMVNPPKLGRIVILTTQNTTEEISSFTQEMVDDGLIRYEHTDKESLTWSTRDSFTFTVSSPPALLVSHEFSITISYDISDTDRSTHLVANTGASVEEGGRVLITKTMLDASNLLIKLPESQRQSYEVWYQVTLMPSHGVIVVGDRNITKEKPNFSQYIINKFGITYVHDGAESLTDNFTFAVWLNLKSKSAVRPEMGVLEEMFNITVLAINDQAPELKTKRPYLKVLQGKSVLIGPDNVSVEDLDNLPEDIKYTIISPPNNGFLAKHDNLNTTTEHFTQAEINNGHVWFVQDGSPSSGVFYFSVTDGKHKPLYKLFNIEVTPVSITMVNKTNLIFRQGQTLVNITTSHLRAVTDGMSAVINYYVTHSSLFGHLAMDNKPVIEFDQTDIDLGKLTFHIGNLNASQDGFGFDVFTTESNLTGQELNITVEPLLNVETDLKIATGTVYVLKRKDMDATELANLTMSDPEFQLINSPMHARLVQRKNNQKHILDDIDTFRQSDIDTGCVLLDVYANVTEGEMLNDSFTFFLKADNVPPAIGYFPFVVVPYDSNLVEVTTTETLVLTSGSLSVPTTVISENNLTFWQNNMTTNASIKSVHRFGNRNRWGNHKDEEHVVSADFITTISPLHKTTIRFNDVSPKLLPRPSTSALPIIIPLVIFAVLLMAAIFFVWFLLLKRRKRKAERDKPHVRSQSYSIVPQAPSPYTERSATVPTVTVTPLQKGSDYISGSPLLSTRNDHFHTKFDPSLNTKAQQNSWLAMDPEMIQHCRTTNPTLKINQYWV
uniref:Laminin G domain-containing protein n=1 Tax=Leptobrachium leishanense TaxID=445787 RepID=A0A8C5M3B5_9ANUR